MISILKPKVFYRYCSEQSSQVATVLSKTIITSCGNHRNRKDFIFLLIRIGCMRIKTQHADYGINYRLEPDFISQLSY